MNIDNIKQTKHRVGGCSTASIATCDISVQTPPIDRSPQELLQTATAPLGISFTAIKALPVEEQIPYIAKMLTRSAASILLCCFLFGSSLQAPRLIPVTEDCPNKCVCTINDGMMKVDCWTDDEFKALEKPSPEEDLNVHNEIELVKPMLNSDTAPEETASDEPQALNASVEQDEKPKQQNYSEPRIVIESAIAVDVEEKPKENEIESDKFPVDEEMMQADEQHPDDEIQTPSDDDDDDDDTEEGEKELPETLVNDHDSKVVAKKGTHLHPIKEEEWQGDQAPEDSYEEYETEEGEDKTEEKEKQKSDTEDGKQKLQEEEEKQGPEEDMKPDDKPVLIEEMVQTKMDNETEKVDASEIKNDEEKDTADSLEKSESVPLEQAVETKEDTLAKIGTKYEPTEEKTQASQSLEEEELPVDNENKDTNIENSDETVVLASDTVGENSNMRPEDAVEEDANESKEKVEPVVVAEDEEINSKEKDLKEEKIDPISEDTKNNSDEESTEKDEIVPLIETQNKQAAKEEDKSSSFENGDIDAELENIEEESKPDQKDDNDDDTKSSKESEEDINNEEIRIASADVNKDTESETMSAEKEASKEEDIDSDLIQDMEVNGNPKVQDMEVDGNPNVHDIPLDDVQEELTTPITLEEEIVETVEDDKKSENQSNLESPTILIVKPELNNETDTDDEKNGTDIVASRSRQNTNDQGPDNYILPDGEILVNGNIDDTMTGKIIDEQEEESMETTQPQQSTASWVILGLILGTFVVVLGYAAIRGSINKKKEAEITADSKTTNSIPPVFDSKFTRKPDFETGTELKELSRPFLQPSEEPVREYKDTKHELDEVVVNGKDMSTGLPYIDAPNPLLKLQRPNAPPPLDLPAPNDTSRHDSTTTSPSPEPTTPELQQHTLTSPTLVRTRIVDNSPQILRMNSNEHATEDD
ncbi:hypothetical protein B566_EDAN006062 [Ephemera danica]|nr:hypothetical protein B566_EDAN006062 [Ephemera danica]